MAWQTPKTNWKAADVVRKDDFNRIEGNIQHLQDTKETPTGAQVKANAAEANAKGYTDTHAGTKNTHGVGSGYYIAKTSRSDQLPAWSDVQGKPSNFTPSAHKSTHASGGSDALTPSDIGAAAAVHTHSNLSVNGKALTGAVTLSASDVGAAAASHTHGNISSDGKIGSTANRAIYTGTGGTVQAGTLPISAGGTGATSAASARTSIGAAAFVSGTATISTGWDPAGQGYYTQAVTATGVLATDNVDVTRVVSVSDMAAAELIQDAWNQIFECVVSTNKLTFYASEVPSVAIPIVWKVVR